MEIRDRFAAALERDPRTRAVGLTGLVVLVCAILSIGQITYENRAALASRSTTAAADQPGSTVPMLPVATEPPVPTAGATGPATPGDISAPPATAGTGSKGPATTAGKPPAPGKQAYPDLGLVTQGVTATTVKIGATYDKSGCGDSGTISQQLGTAVTGDPEKSYAAYVQYVNDTGGIRGRTLSLVTEDDGGTDCTADNKASAVALIDTDKVFMVLPGLHEVSDYVATRHIPFLGGRSSKAEEQVQGPGQFQVFQDADGDFANWAAFGKNYLHADTEAPCLAHPDTDDFNNLEPLLVSAMAAQGLKFRDVYRYADDDSTAESSAQTAAVMFKADGCQSVWLVANNALADVFFTNAAAQQDYYPQAWTWTSRTALIDASLGGSLMNQQEWANSVGLSVRVPAGKSPEDGNCAAIYTRYEGNDGESTSAAAQLACAQVLLAAEAMRRAIDVTGTLDANSLMQGVNAIQKNFYWDATVPLTFHIPDRIATQPFDVTGFDVETIAKWDGATGAYDFPYYPTYWTQVGPGLSGGEDISSDFATPYPPG